MTRLRKMMLEELQRRNYAKSTVKPTSGSSKNSPGISINRPTGSVHITCASIKPTCFRRRSWMLALCSCMWRRSASSMSRH